MRYKIEKLRNINDAKSFMHGYQTSCSFQLLKYSMYLIIAILATLIVWSKVARKDIVVNTFGLIYMDDNTCTAFIENTRIGNIGPDMDVRIEIVSLSKKEYGVINTKVKEVSEDVVADQKTGQKYFTATCNLNTEFLQGKNGDKVQLKSGMEAKVSIVCKKTTYFDYILNKLG